MHNNHIFKTLFTGHFTSNEVQIDWQPQQRTLPPTLISKMEAFWKQEIVAKDKQHFIFNGDLCRLNSWQIEIEILRLDLGLTNYKELLYSNRFTAELEQEFGESCLSKALGISVVLMSNDDQLILIKRSGSVGEFPNCIDVIGGHIHPQEHATDSIPDAFLAIKDEIREELDLSVKDDAKLKCIGAIETIATKKPELVFQLKIDLKAQNVLEMASQKKCSEIAEVFTIPNNSTDLEGFLKSSQDKLSPSAYGVLSLYNSHKSGDTEESK